MTARLAAVLVVALLARARAPHAHAARPPERARASLATRVGLAKSPFPSADAHEISGLLTSLLLEGEAQIGLVLAARLRLPLVLAGVDQPAGSARSDTAWGHPEAALLWRLHETAAASLIGRLALAVPLPGGDAALARRPLDNQALVLASALGGTHDQELYAPGRAALTASARIDVGRGPVAVFGELKLPFMLAVARGGGGDPGTNVRALAIATAAAAGASVSWWRLRAGMTPWLIVDLLPAAEIRGAATRRWTLTVDPEVSIRVSDQVGAALTLTIPVAGALPAVPAIGFTVTGQLERNPP